MCIVFWSLAQNISLDKLHISMCFMNIYWHYFLLGMTYICFPKNCSSWLSVSYNRFFFLKRENFSGHFRVNPPKSQFSSREIWKVTIREFCWHIQPGLIKQSRQAQCGLAQDHCFGQLFGTQGEVCSLACGSWKCGVGSLARYWIEGFNKKNLGHNVTRN